MTFDQRRLQDRVEALPTSPDMPFTAFPGSPQAAAARAIGAGPMVEATLGVAQVVEAFVLMAAANATSEADLVQAVLASRKDLQIGILHMMMDQTTFRALGDAVMTNNLGPVLADLLSKAMVTVPVSFVVNGTALATVLADELMRSQCREADLRAEIEALKADRADPEPPPFQIG